MNVAEVLSDLFRLRRRGSGTTAAMIRSLPLAGSLVVSASKEHGRELSHLISQEGKEALVLPLAELEQARGLNRAVFVDHFAWEALLAGAALQIEEWKQLAELHQAQLKAACVEVNELKHVTPPEGMRITVETFVTDGELDACVKVHRLKALDQDWGPLVELMKSQFADLGGNAEAARLMTDVEIEDFRCREQEDV